MKSIRNERSKNAEWIKKHAQVRSKHAIKPHFHKWTSECLCTGIPVSDRAHDLVDLAGEVFQSRLLAEGVDSKDGEVWKTCDYCLDLSQCGSREPFSQKCRSMVSNTNLFFYPRSRALVPKEHLLLLGWPLHMSTKGLTPTAIRDLCGESMAVPCVALATMAVVLNIPDGSLWQMGR